MYRGVSIHCFKISAPIFCYPLFSENYLNTQVRINKMVNKFTVNYHPSPSQLISGIHPLIFLWTSKGFISPESFLNFFLKLHIPPWLQKSFKFTNNYDYCKYICESKNWICPVSLMPPSKNLPQVFIIIPQADGNSPFPSAWELKKLPKLAKISVTSFDKFHHLCNI